MTNPFRSRRALVILSLAGLLVVGPIAYRILSGGPTTPAELASYLPDKEGALIYVDVDAVRKSGILDMIAGSKAAEEADYKEFVAQTGFDYKHDLDAIAVTMRGGQMFFTARGRFAWDKLSAYAGKQGGACKNTYCVVDGSQPRRRISFYRLRSNLIALAVSTDDMAAYQITRNASKVSPFTPDAPLWMMVPPAVLRENTSLPAGLRSFTLPLESAERTVFSVSQDKDRMKVSLNVTCQNVEAASALLVQLESTTNTLRKLLARERQAPNPGDLTGVLVAGSFRRDDRRVLGEWPVERVFVNALAGGSH